MLSLIATTAFARTSVKSATSKSAVASSGRFTLLTYNVAGLPEFISQSDPLRNIPVIGRLLNLYDVAVVQEDFAYHPQLAEHAQHAYQSPPAPQNQQNGMGDGLNIFSRLPANTFQRVPWKDCFGTFSNYSDCLTPKGFVVSVLHLAPGVDVDLYDLHMDAGRSPGDLAARASQTTQLLAHIAEHSKGHAVVVAGDTNMTSDADLHLGAFEASEGLVDTCRTLHCKSPRLIDRVLYRSSAEFELRAARFLVDSRFVKSNGGDLSDHKAVGVELEWRLRDETKAHAVAEH